MSQSQDETFRRALAAGSGTLTLCEVRVDGPQCTRISDGQPGAYRIRHRDTPAQGPFLRRSSTASDARFFVRNTASGEYRPLKGAPNLPRDWLLELSTAGDARRALDFLYPAALALWVTWRSGTAAAVPFSETAARQTGMYRVVGSAPPDIVQSTAASVCSSRGGCLRTLLWQVSPDHHSTLLPATKCNPSIDQARALPAAPGHIPYLCVEACNFFVAACRTALKASLAPPNATADAASPAE